jgi:LMBR1 domain-containing protein 1
MSFGGWFLLSLFGGAGLFTLPLDLIKSFVNRPKIIKP